MIVLGLDTTGSACSVSIVDDATVRAHICEDIGRGHAERLAGMVEEVFLRADLKPDDIDRIAVCTGPGNFTGLRVALSFAKGFALPRNLPVVGIDALAAAHMQMNAATIPYTVPYKDVRRGQVMFGVYSGTRPLLAGYPKLGKMEDARAEANSLQLDLVEVVSIDTRILAWVAIGLDPAHHPAEPLYARAPDAKLPGGRSL